MGELIAVIRATRSSALAVLGAVAAGVLTAGAGLALAGLSAWLITKAATMPPVLTLSLAVTAVRALGITRGLMRYVERIAAHRLALAGLTELRVRLYRELAAAPSARTMRRSTGELLARTGTDVDAVGEAMVRTLLPGAVAVTTALAAVGWIYLIDPRAAIALGACLIVAGAVVPWLTVVATRARAAAEAAGSEEFGAAASALLDHGGELAVAGRLPDIRARGRRAEQLRRRAVDRAARISAIADAAMPLSVSIAAVAALLVAWDRAGAVDATTVGILVLLPLGAFEALMPLPDAARQYVRSAAAAAKLAPLLAEAEKVTAPTPSVQAVPPEPTLRLGSVTLNAGERLVVRGESGAGKTTFLLALAGLDPRGGAVSVAGTPGTHYRHLNRHVAFFGEDAHIFATTVAENCRVSNGAVTDRDIEDALAAVGLQTWLAGLPDGIGTVLTSGGDSLSGGQRRRLLLARAVLSAADVVLLDEPTEHLDRTDSQQLLTDILDPNGLFPHRTVVVAGHVTPPPGVATIAVAGAIKSVATPPSTGVPSISVNERRWSTK